MKNLDPREIPVFPEDLRTEGVAPEAQDAVWALLDEWKAGEPSEGFHAAVLARIQAEESHAVPGGWTHGLVAWFSAMDVVRGLGLAGTLATVLFAVALLREPVTMPEELHSQTASQELSAQQVEMALEDLRMLDELYSAPTSEDNQNKKI